MRRIAAMSTGLALAFAMMVTPRMMTEAHGQGRREPGGPPGGTLQSKAYGKTLTEWMQRYWTWSLGGGGEDHDGNVTFLPLPNGDLIDGSITYNDPALLVGHLDISLKPGTPFVLPVIVWYGETYDPALHFPNDPVLPASLFTDPSKATTKVYIDGRPVMDSTIASVSPYYYGPAPISVTYAEPTSYGSIGAVYVQGVGFVQEPLSVGPHTIALTSEVEIPPQLHDPQHDPLSRGIRDQVHEHIDDHRLSALTATSSRHASRVAGTTSVRATRAEAEAKLGPR